MLGSGYTASTALPKSQLDKSITYALNNWRALCRFLVHGELEIDKSRSEGAIGPFAIGRKNWLFAGSREGGRNAAIIASFVATCEEHKVNPQLYLKDLITRLTAGAVVQLDSTCRHWWHRRKTQSCASFINGC
jgi:transposase